jgi:serine/threonine protein kinase/formylglycine-generating enzyme required for sulfatase activity
MEFQKRYEFNPKTDLLGKGGFSRVYKATDMLLERTVALKFFTADASTKYQILSEIKKVIRFEHQNLCKYYDVALLSSENVLGETESIEVGIMEYLDAGDFKTFTKANPEHIDKLFVDILKGLAYLHKRGIVHRDLKPQNILIKIEDDEPIAKITDFGISKVLKADDNNSTALMGTIEYMAPEQFNPKRYGVGGRITTNLDLWSFGLLVYETMTHEKLFGSRSTGVSAEQVMSNILGDLPLLQSANLKGKYRGVVERCLVKDASQRVQNASELIAIFEHADFSQSKSKVGSASLDLSPDDEETASETAVEDETILLSSGNALPASMNNQAHVEAEPVDFSPAGNIADSHPVQSITEENEFPQSEVNPEADQPDSSIALVPDAVMFQPGIETATPRQPELTQSADLSAVVPQFVDKDLADIIHSSELSGDNDATQLISPDKSIDFNSETDQFDLNNICNDTTDGEIKSPVQTRASYIGEAEDNTAIIQSNEFLSDQEETQLIHPIESGIVDVALATGVEKPFGSHEQIEDSQSEPQVGEDDTQIIELKPATGEDDTQLINFPSVGEEETKLISPNPSSDDDTQLILPKPTAKEEETRIYAYKQLPKKSDDKQIIRRAPAKSPDLSEISKRQDVVYKVDDSLIQSIKDEMAISDDTQVLQHTDLLAASEETRVLNSEKEDKKNLNSSPNSNDTIETKDHKKNQSVSESKFSTSPPELKQRANVLQKRSFLAENVETGSLQTTLGENKETVGRRRNISKIVILSCIAAALAIILLAILLPVEDNNKQDNSKVAADTLHSPVMPQTSGNKADTVSSVVTEIPIPAIKPSVKELEKTSTETEITPKRENGKSGVKSKLETSFTASEDCTLEIEGLAPITLKKNKPVMVPMDFGRHNITAVSKKNHQTNKTIIAILRNNQSFDISFEEVKLTEPSPPAKDNEVSENNAPVTATTPTNTVTNEKDIAVAKEKATEADPSALNRAALIGTATEIAGNMANIRGGKFTKIDSRSEKEKNESQSISLAPYQLGRYEVTQRQWQQVMGYNNSSNKNCPDCPVENVSWEEVNMFLQKLNQNGKARFRLPTDAEWSFAVQMDDRDFIDANGGMEYPNKVAWLDNNSQRKTHPVGKKIAHKAGVYDLMGNVAEWCSDWYDPSYLKNNKNLNNPTGPTSGSRKVVRGGNFSDASVVTTAGLSPAAKQKTVGFRLVRY